MNVTEYGNCVCGMAKTMAKEMNEMGYGLKEMNEMDYGLKGARWNMINEVDNVTRLKLTLTDDVMMCCKPITEQLKITT